MTGKMKRLMAILAAVGITADGIVEFLTHVMKAFPDNKWVHGAGTIAVTVIGLLVAYHPISIKDPNAGKPELPPVKP